MQDASIRHPHYRAAVLTRLDALAETEGLAGMRRGPGTIGTRKLDTIVFAHQRGGISAVRVLPGNGKCEQTANGNEQPNGYASHAGEANDFALV